MFRSTHSMIHAVRLLVVVSCVWVHLASTPTLGAPAILTGLPVFSGDKPEACVTVMVVDPGCDALAVALNASAPEPVLESIRYQLSAGASAKRLEAQYVDYDADIWYPLAVSAPQTHNGAAIPSARVCTTLPTLALMCVNLGSVDDAVVIQTASRQPWSAAVVVREQRCDALVVDIATSVRSSTSVVHGAWLPVQASHARTTTSSAVSSPPSCFYGVADTWAFARNASDVVTRVMPRSLATWHTHTHLALLGDTHSVSFVLPPPMEKCNDTFYAEAIDVLRRQQDLSRFRFSWKHARPNVVAFLWASVLATYQMGLCVGVFWRHPRVFLIVTLVLMSLHIPLIGHIEFDAYIVATLCALLLPFVVAPVTIGVWFCTRSTRQFKLPERQVADNVFMCLLVILLHGMFLLVSLTQTTA